MPRRITDEVPDDVLMPAPPTLAASRLAQLAICPGYTKDLFEVDSSAADDGARLHTLIEQELLDGTGVITGDDSDLALWCVELAKSEAGSFYSINPEVEIKIPFIKKSGWIDVLLMSHDGKRAIIMDWKTGRNKQAHPSENLQFKAYAVGVWMKYPGLQEIVLIGAYPRLRSVERAVFTPDDYTAMLETLAEIHVKCKDFTGRLTPNDSCKYCGRASTCSALTGVALDTLRVLKSELPVGLDPELVPASRPDILAVMRDMAGVLEGWAKAVKARSDYVALKQGYDLPGYEVQTKSGRRSFRNPGEVLDLINATLEQLGVDHVTESELLAVCSPTVSDAEGIIKAKAPPKKGAEFVREFKSVCESHAALTAGDDIVFLKRNPSIKIVLA